MCGRTLRCGTIVVVVVGISDLSSSLTFCFRPLLSYHQTFLWSCQERSSRSGRLSFGLSRVHFSLHGADAFLHPRQAQDTAREHLDSFYESFCKQIGLTFEGVSNINLSFLPFPLPFPPFPLLPMKIFPFFQSLLPLFLQLLLLLFSTTFPPSFVQPPLPPFLQPLLLPSSTTSPSPFLQPAKCLIIQTLVSHPFLSLPFSYLSFPSPFRQFMFPLLLVSDRRL